MTLTVAYMPYNVLRTLLLYHEEMKKKPTKQKMPDEVKKLLSEIDKILSDVIKDMKKPKKKKKKRS